MSAFQWNKIRPINGKDGGLVIVSSPAPGLNHPAFVYIDETGETIKKTENEERHELKAFELLSYPDFQNGVSKEKTKNNGISAITASENAKMFAVEEELIEIGKQYKNPSYCAIHWTKLDIVVIPCNGGGFNGLSVFKYLAIGIFVGERGYSVHIPDFANGTELVFS